MPTTHLPPYDSKVQVIFKGIILAKIREAYRDVQGAAMIGALDPTLPGSLVCHQPIVQVLGISRQGIVKTITNLVTDPALDFYLLVGDSQQDELEPDIKRYQKDEEAFNRLDDENDVKDFRWFVDLEDLHDVDITVHETRLRPKFFMNKGVFYTNDLMDEEVRRKKSNHTSRFGRVAMEMAARVKLEAGTQAVFWQGNDPIFTLGAGRPDNDNDVDRYEIVYDCRCRNSEDHSDFKLIYLVIDVPSGEEISLPTRSEEAKKSNPEVYCVGGHYGG